MTRILLVNHKAEKASTLVSGLKPACADWQILVSDSIDEGISRISDQCIECVVADASGLDGETTDELVKKCKVASPSTILLLLTHDCGAQAIVDSCRANQRSIDKDISIKRLVEIIGRSLELQKALNNPTLNAAVSEIKHLPTLPAIYKKLSEEVSARDSSAYSVSLIIETDSALSATILRVVNSAFYGLSRPVDSVSQAVSLLGVHLIKNITLTTKVFSQFSGTHVDQKRLEAHNENANRLGALSNHFARLAGVSREIVDQAQISGMLDSIGELILLSEPNLRNTGDEDSQTTHANQATLLSAYLLRFWLMPESIVEAIALKQQTPDQPYAVIDPLVISSAIYFLDKHLTHVENDEQKRHCRQQLIQWIPEKLADKWIKSYCDLQLLVG